MVVDFAERLKDKVNAIPALTIRCKLGYLGTEESLVLYPLPGSRTVAEYMDGSKDQQLNYEFAMKSKSHNDVGKTLWLIQDELDNLEELESNDGSFHFEELIITSKPFINEANTQGFYTFLLDVQAKINVNKEEKQ